MGYTGLDRPVWHFYYFIFNSRFHPQFMKLKTTRTHICSFSTWIDFYFFNHSIFRSNTTPNLTPLETKQSLGHELSITCNFKLNLLKRAFVDARDTMRNVHTLWALLLYEQGAPAVLNMSQNVPSDGQEPLPRNLTWGSNSEGLHPNIASMQRSEYWILIS